MTWDSFIFFAIPALLLWAGGAWTAWKKRPLPTYLLTAAGLLVYFAFILGLWMSLERPPLRTMGETRLWYAFFLPTAGLIVYSRWRYPWILAFSTILAGVFTTINIVNPDIHNKTLMPALQSPWFAPHVIVYMFAYAVLGAAALMSAYLLWFKKSPINDHEMDICDNLVQVGWAFMTVGILFGALWAKEAWGHSGRRKPGGTTGRGTPRRPGPLRHGSPIWLISTCASVRTATAVQRSGGSSSPSSSCRCAGGASTTCPLPKASASTPTAWAKALRP